MSISARPTVSSGVHHLLGSSSPKTSTSLQSFQFARPRSVRYPLDKNHPTCFHASSRSQGQPASGSRPPHHLPPMKHLVKESAAELVKPGVCLVCLGVPVWVNLGVVDLKQKLRTLVSALCLSGTSPVHGPAPVVQRLPHDRVP